MTSYRHEFHESAEIELNRAGRYYDDLEPGLGGRFLDDIQIGLDQILGNPLAWPVQKGSVRKKVLGKFPYSIMYSIEDDRILILAIMNQFKKPDYWQSRF